MGNATGKKVALLAVFLVMMAGLGIWIARFNPGYPGVPPRPQPGPTLDTAKLAARWPEIMSRAAAPARGSASARYTLAEFGDFQCPQCGRAWPYLESLLKNYPNQVNLVFVHRPFPQMHQWAIPAGQASEIAAVQGKFWPMYDVLYAHQNDLEPGFYADYAAEAGMNKAAFQKAFDSGHDVEKVKSAAAFCDSLGITETPTILLHDRVKNTVTVFLGLDGTKLANGSPQYPGLRQLSAQPPWAG